MSLGTDDTDGTSQAAGALAPLTGGAHTDHGRGAGAFAIVVWRIAINVAKCDVRACACA
jgi:hypothetical protein